jgi:soluble lytic murein transglycosylase-like protein
MREHADGAPGRDGALGWFVHIAVWRIAVWIVAAASPAGAQVLEIDPAGHVETVSGPALYLTPDMHPQPIVAPAPAPRRAIASGYGSPARAAPLPAAVTAEIEAAAARHSVSAALLRAVAWRESHFQQGAVSPKGARGVMQLMPATAAGLHVNADVLSSNVDGGAAYLTQLLERYDGDLRRALAAYNAGPLAVDRYRGVPPYPETRAYVAAILDRLSEAALAPSPSP